MLRNFGHPLTFDLFIFKKKTQKQRLKEMFTTVNGSSVYFELQRKNFM